MPSGTVRKRNLHARLALVCWSAVAVCMGDSETQAFDGPKKGNVPGVGALKDPALVDYYKDFVKTQELDTFTQRILARYPEASLAKLLESDEVEARRAAVLAIGLTGSMQSNAALAGRFKDDDVVVRAYAERAIWMLWNRADTAENNTELEKVHSLISEERFEEAIKRATDLVKKSPQFAEAWNQRAIAHFIQGELEKSVADCREVLKRNPYHFGAMSGMAGCLMKMGKLNEALEVFHQQLKIQPFNEGIRAAIDSLERGRL